MHFLVHLEDTVADTIASHVSEESGHQKKDYFAEICHSSGKSKLEGQGGKDTVNLKFSCQCASLKS